MVTVQKSTVIVNFLQLYFSDCERTKCILIYQTEKSLKTLSLLLAKQATLTDNVTSFLG